MCGDRARDEGGGIAGRERGGDDGAQVAVKMLNTWWRWLSEPERAWLLNTKEGLAEMARRADLADELSEPPSMGQALGSQK